MKKFQIPSLLFFSVLSILLIKGFSFSSPLRAEEKIPELIIKDHKYYPETLEVKAGERFKIKVTNQDPTSEEFESRSMIIEKFIGPKRSITVTLGPLKPGTYDFFGCFHPQTAKGKIIVK